jgi:hypothetical protein
MDAVTRLKTCSAGGSVAGGKFSPNSSSPTCGTEAELNSCVCRQMAHMMMIQPQVFRDVERAWLASAAWSDTAAFRSPDRSCATMHLRC